MNGRELIKIMKHHGWVIDRVSGSHHIMIKNSKRAIPVPVHGKKDLPRGLVAAIFRQAGIKEKK